MAFIMTAIHTTQYLFLSLKFEFSAWVHIEYSQELLIADLPVFRITSIQEMPWEFCCKFIELKVRGFDTEYLDPDMRMIIKLLCVVVSRTWSSTMRTTNDTI